MALPRFHALLTLPLAGAVVAATKRRDLSVVMAAGSVLLDVDHILDYAQHRFKFQLWPRGQVLHNVEPALVLLLAGIFVRRQRLAALAGGVLFHLIVDAFTLPGRGRHMFLLWPAKEQLDLLSIRANDSWRVRLGGFSPDWRKQPFWQWF